jgi:hypothetical protein
MQQMAFNYPASRQYLPTKSGRLILELIHGYFKRTKKPWAYIDQVWIMEKLQQWRGVKVSRSTLNYNLRRLEDEGFLIRTSRHYTDPHTGRFTPRVTMYKITKKLKSFFFQAAEYFKRCGWVPSLKALKAGYLAAVGMATTPAEAVAVCAAERRRRGRSG